MNKQNIVLYHDNCVDGMTSAWIARRNLGEDNTEFIPVQYNRNDPVPNLLGRNLYMLDFCYPAEIISKMVVDVAQFILLDHHKTAEADMRILQHRLADDTRVHIEFDMERSGAGITADYFQDRNWWVNYVEDRDLWRFKLEHSESINAYIQSVERTMDAYDHAFASVEKEEAKVLGMGALQYLRMYIREMVSLSRLADFQVGDHVYSDIPFVNTPYVGCSEVVGELAKTAPFGVGWYMRGDGKVSFSLRSRGDVDVSSIAKQFGGGGHQGAAGFNVPFSEAVRRFGQIFGVAV